ncbi:uncharacterized protein LOC143623181 [Bidens hawaiensis]|uniref:uncharacterized protein LOC143623181 n=1 Tax=Bidens hawaiensis TaxID=980011 RepID=UPI00404B5566
MRCKKHNSDLSSIVGVCASCLRERLLKVIVAEEQAQAQAQSQPQNQRYSNTNTNTNTNQQPPRSGVNRTNSVATVQRPNNKPRLDHSLSDQWFYNSPQVTINTGGGCIGGGGSSNKKKNSLIRFSSFSNLFKSNAREGDAESTSGEPSGAAGKPTSVTSSPMWFSNSRHKNKAVYVNESVRKQRYVRDRGVSPVGSSDDEEEVSGGSSGYESAESLKNTPKKTPSRQTVRRTGGQSGVFGLVFCLSPLVRASPHRVWNLKGKPPVDNGDFRPSLSNVKSFCANRSRKLADFGRSNPNR